MKQPKTSDGGVEHNGIPTRKAETISRAVQVPDLRGRIPGATFPLQAHHGPVCIVPQPRASRQAAAVLLPSYGSKGRSFGLRVGFATYNSHGLNAGKCFYNRYPLSIRLRQREAAQNQRWWCGTQRNTNEEGCERTTACEFGSHREDLKFEVALAGLL